MRAWRPMIRATAPGDGDEVDAFCQVVPEGVAGVFHVREDDADGGERPDDRVGRRLPLGCGEVERGQEVQADADAGAVVVDDGRQAGERSAGVLLKVLGGEGSEGLLAGQALACLATSSAKHVKSSANCQPC